MDFLFRNEKLFLFGTLSRIIFFTLVTQSATRTIHPSSSRPESNQTNPIAHVSNNTAVVNSFQLSHSIKDKIENLEEEINQIKVIMQSKSENSNRYKRGNISPPKNSNNKQLSTLENEISELRQKIGLIKSSLSLNTADKSRIDGLERSIDGLRKSLDNENQNLEQVLSVHDEKLQSFAQSLNNLSRDFDEMRKNIERKEAEEAKRRAYDDIVRFLQSHQFSEAEQKLNQTDDAAYIYAVKKVYNNQAGNFDLLLTFGDYVRNSSNKFKVFDALYYEIRSNDHGDLRRLLRLSHSIKKGVLDQSSNATTGESLFNTLNNAIQDAAVEPFSNAFLNDNSWPMVKQLSNDVANICLRCLGQIYEKVIDDVLDKVGTRNLLTKAHDNLKTLEEHISIHLAVTNKLQHDQASFASSSLSVARFMKLTMSNVNYSNVNSNLRSRHEEIKKKFPETIRDFIFSSDKCPKNTRCGDYMYY